MTAVEDLIRVIRVGQFRYDPGQPRVPAGSSGGGRWGGGGDGGSSGYGDARPGNIGEGDTWQIGADDFGRASIQRRVYAYTGWDDDEGMPDTESPVEQRWASDGRGEGDGHMDSAPPPSADVADRLSDTEVRAMRAELDAAAASVLEGVEMATPDGFAADLPSALSDRLILNELNAHLLSPLPSGMADKYLPLLAAADMGAIREAAITDFAITPESALIYTIGSEWNSSALSTLGVAVGLTVDPGAYGYMQAATGSIGNQRQGNPQADYARATEIMSALPTSLSLASSAVNRHTADVLSEMYPAGDVPVYRGVTRPTPTGVVSINPVSSWSLEVQWAANFGERTVKSTVPVESVFSYGAATGWGAQTEAEVILSTPTRTVTIEDTRTDDRWKQFAASDLVNIDEGDEDWIKHVVNSPPTATFRYDASQPRVPAGSPGGGRWGGVAASEIPAGFKPFNPNPNSGITSPRQVYRQQTTGGSAMYVDAVVNGKPVPIMLTKTDSASFGIQEQIDAVNAVANVYEMAPSTQVPFLTVPSPHGGWTQASNVMAFVSTATPNEIVVNPDADAWKWTDTTHLMPSAQAHSPVDYFMAHEYGHVRLITGSDSKDRLNFAARAVVYDNFAGMSEYGRTNALESHAEAFAEWALGATKNRSVSIFAETYDWEMADDRKIPRITLVASAGPKPDDPYFDWEDIVLLGDGPDGPVYERSAAGATFRYDNSQPRVPAGSSAGGRWGGPTGASGRPIPPPPGRRQPRRQAPSRPSGVLPDVPFSKVKIAYKPRHPDGKPDPGEIVWAQVPFEEDPTRSKDRPVLIIGRTEDGNLVGVQLTSKQGGTSENRLPVGSGTWDTEHRDSYLKLDRFVQIDEENYRREGAYVKKPAFQAVVDELTKRQHAEKVVLAAETVSWLTVHRSCAVHQLAGCKEASCAPPPYGTGGSKLTGEEIQAEVDSLSKAQRSRYDTGDGGDHERRMWDAAHGGSDNTGLHESTAAERKALGVNPGLRYVMVADTAGGNPAGLVARGIAPNGQVQPQYSEAHSAKQAAAKYERQAALHEAMPKLDRALARDAATVPAAAAVQVMRVTGLRIDSGGGTAAKGTASGEATYGASSLEARHVTVTDNLVRFEFIGKGSKPVDIAVRNKALAATMTTWKAGKSGNDRLYDTTAAATDSYIDRATGGDFKNHDIRTYKANTLAVSAVSKMPTVYRSRKALETARRKVGTVVSDVLGNTPSTALKSYVNPAVFNDWEVAA